MSPNILSSSLSNQKVVYNDDEVALMKSELKKPKHWYKFDTEIKWRNVMAVVSLYSAFIYSVLTFPYLEHPFLCFWIWLMYIEGGFGINGITHRYWTHQSYKATVPFQIFGAILFYSAGMNPIYRWVRDHRLHHKYADTEADPHNATRGFFFSHIGWLMLKRKPIVIHCGKEIYMCDIIKNPVIQFFDRYHGILMPFFAFVLPVFLPVYFFNQDLKMTMISQLFIRYPWLLNTAFSVNSVAHTYGTRSYDKSIHSTDNAWFSFCAGGEGFQNFHHTFPWDYRAATHTNIFTNLCGFLIDIQGKIGWAYDFKTVSDEQIEKFIERKTDGNRLRNDKLKES